MGGYLILRELGIGKGSNNHFSTNDRPPSSTIKSDTTINNEVKICTSVSEKEGQRRKERDRESG
jgi:hypothetical protein